MNIKQKAQEFKGKVIFRTNQAYTWCKDNPGMAIAIGSAIFVGGKFCSKAVIKHKDIKDQENMKDLYCFKEEIYEF